MLKLIVLLLVVGHLVDAHSVYSLSQLEQTRRVQEVEITQLGDHVIAEFLGCTNLDAYTELEGVLREAAQAARATVIEVVIHKFSPIGMSGIVLLAESHLSIHTWPEHGYAAIDIYTCGEHVDIYAAIEVFKHFFQPKKVRHITIDRGCQVGDKI